MFDIKFKALGVSEAFQYNKPVDGSLELEPDNFFLIHFGSVGCGCDLKLVGCFIELLLLYDIVKR